MYVKPSYIYNSVPTKEEVKWAVRRIRVHRSGFPYRMRTEHHWEWRREHQVAEASAEAKGLTSPKERGRGADEGGELGEEQDKSKW